MELTYRPRRLRRTEPVRTLTRETVLNVGDLIFPMFVTEGVNVREPIDSMPGQFRFSVDELVRECETVFGLGICGVNLFGYSEEKDERATMAYKPDGLIQRAVRALKAALPDLCVQTDVALDPYTTHGHDGLLIDGEIANDESVGVLCRMSLSHAEAGVDWVTPSDMMDGRIGAIRVALDDLGFRNVGIMAYSAKYASCFYGPFRGALKSAPVKARGVPKDKKTYQMDPANVREAMKEIALDIQEGARRGDGETGAAVPRRHRKGEGEFRHAHCGVQRVRRIRDGPGGRGAGMGGKGARHGRNTYVHQAGGRGYDSDLLCRGNGATVEGRDVAAASDETHVEKPEKAEFA